jgi:hypothetical protein
MKHLLSILLLAAIPASAGQDIGGVLQKLSVDIPSAYYLIPGLDKTPVTPEKAASGGEFCEGNLADRLYNAAYYAPSRAKSDGTLYGMQRWYPETSRTYAGMTFKGFLSCAYTVSAIFRGACSSSVGTQASVAGVKSRLSGWKKITDPDALEKGDVIFWEPTPDQSVLGVSCGSNWHVGISLGGRRNVNNDWWSGYPKAESNSRSCGKFSFARRPTK